MPLGGYDYGTISVANGDTTVTASNVSTELKEFDLFYAGGALGLIDARLNSTQFTLKKPWAGPDLVGVSYLIVFMPVDLAWSMTTTRQLLDKVAGKINVWFVPVGDEAPDPGIGEDGDAAFRLTLPWLAWQKIDGVWVEKGSPAGINWRVVWNAGSNYVTSDVVTRLGALYIASANNINMPPESNPDDWDLLLQGGNRYDLMWSDSDQPASGETVIKVVMTTTVTFPAGMAESRAIADIGATANAVFSMRKNGVEFGTYTFAAGHSVATFACPSATTFAPGDVYSEIAPAPRDSALSGVSATKTGYR